MSNSYDLAVIGAGPGGYVAAIRAAQLGLKVACIEKESALGGTCLRIGCIPSKALLESSEHYEAAQTKLAKHGLKFQKVGLDLKTMMERKQGVVQGLTKGIEGLFKKNKITRYSGHARFIEPLKLEIKGKKTETIEAKKIIIATGSSVATLPGVELDGDLIGTSTEALAYDKVPAHLIVIGAGFIGLELGSVWRRLGAKVTVVEYLDRILPGIDNEIAAEALKIFKKQGMEFKLGAAVSAARVEKKKCIVEIKDEATPLQADRVLLAVGRKPNTEGLGLETIGLELDERGRIPIAEETFETKLPGVYAIGDVIRGPMLAHKAEEEGMACVEGFTTGYSKVHYDQIPGVCYTHPEIASVGKTEEELKKAGIAFKKGAFPFLANGRAHALADTEGKVKILADAKTDRILGVHILGPRAGTLIAEATAAIAFGASAEDLFRVCHAHPTLPEALKEAALGVHGRSIHI